MLYDLEITLLQTFKEMVDLSKVNKPAIEIMMRMTGMWGLHMFKDLERAMSGWHSSETAEPVKKCINRMLENQQDDLTAQDLFQMARDFVWYADRMLRSPGEIIDILRKIFTAVAANKDKTTVAIEKAKQYLDEMKERPSEILKILESRRPFKDSLVCLCTILFIACLYCSWS